MLPGIASTKVMFNEDIKNWTLQSIYEETKSKIYDKNPQEPPSLKVPG